MDTWQEAHQQGYEQGWVDGIASVDHSLVWHLGQHPFWLLLFAFILTVALRGAWWIGNIQGDKRGMEIGYRAKAGLSPHCHHPEAKFWFTANRRHRSIWATVTATGYCQSCREELTIAIPFELLVVTPSRQVDITGREVLEAQGWSYHEDTDRYINMKEIA